MAPRHSNAKSRRAFGHRVAALTLAGVAAAVTAGALPAGADAPAPPHGLKMHGSSKVVRHGGSNLVDHGGEILPASHVYVVWWGSASQWASDVQGGMTTFFEGLNGSSYVNTATQYMRGASISVTYEGSATDTSTPPSNPSASTLAAEAAREFPTPDPQGIYFVFTSNFPSGGNFCAWHSYGTVDGVVDSVAYMPNTTNIAGCDPGNLYGVSGSEGLRSLANVTAHEFMESITDTLISAWYGSSTSEIGDKCAWQFASAVTLTGGSVWQLQEEWSNRLSGCTQTT